MSISPSGNLHVIFTIKKNIISQVSIENLINQYRNVLLPRRCGRITTLLAKIEFKMFYFFLNVQIHDLFLRIKLRDF
jgi:hypothetical protein